MASPMALVRLSSIRYPQSQPGPRFSSTNVFITGAGRVFPRLHRIFASAPPMKTYALTSTSIISPFPLNHFQPSPPNSHMSRCWLGMAHRVGFGFGPYAARIDAIVLAFLGCFRAAQKNCSGSNCWNKVRTSDWSAAAIAPLASAGDAVEEPKEPSTDYR
jgi:hypothetical protein